MTRNLRNVEAYNIGLDLGTGSVGWAVTDLDGELLRFNKRPTWGSRLFPTAETAADTRLKRGQRRRYERRRWRLDLLQRLFADEMEKVDPEFFIRLSQSRLLPQDRAEGHAAYHWPLFNGTDFTEPDYYANFPTIYHLRAWLMETDERADLRLIYLAFHNIVKARGNFLHQDNPSLSARTADMSAAIGHLCDALADWLEATGEDAPDLLDEGFRASLEEILGNPSWARRDKQEALKGALDLGKDMAKAISDAVVGYKAEFGHIFGEPGEGTKFALSEDEKVDAYRELVPDEGTALFAALGEVYSSYILMGILSGGSEPIHSAALQGSTGTTISYAKVREYVRYGEDLRLLKSLVREYAPKRYDEFFRGDFYEGTHEYDPEAAKGYTRYNARRGMSYEDFAKEVRKLLDKTGAASDPRYAAMLEGFAEERFLRRLKTSDNGSIPYQLHLEEMDAIIENQGRHHPFLLEERGKIEALVSFRIPYYVGPLTLKNAAKGPDGKLRFAWARRKPGMEGEPVYPWNWEEVIDKNNAAHVFINRMTSDCTYLLGQHVLPRCSLLYEEFCVLNELNGAHFTEDGDREHRFDYADRAGIVEDLFRERRTVTYKLVEDWMRKEGRATHPHVSGGQGETKFESGLSSYRFFAKDVFHVEELDERDYSMIETIILWNTLFEDRSILREELERNFGPDGADPRLTEEQIKIICKKRFSGWGKLSREFLEGMKVATDNGPKSIMDVMREGHPAAGARSGGMVLMEVLRDDQLGFQAEVDRRNAERMGSGGMMSVEELPGSPALRRTVNQAVRIVEEVARIAGRPPVNIFIETTRDEDPKKKGGRTKRRYDAIKEAVAAFNAENAALAKELKGFKPADFDNERLVLYFMQGGKSLYSGKELDINRLSEYQVDHIIPQSYIKDDSFENKALVLASENQAKTDNLLISPAIRQKMAPYWRALHDAKLIGDKKFDNLTRDRVGDKKIRGFIARQLVETSQIVKLAKLMLEDHLPDARVVPIRASLSHELREAQHYYKCREINDFHHAHDALLAAEVGRFLLMRHSAAYDNPIGYAAVVKDFIRSQAAEAKKTGRMPGSAGFFVSSFLHSGFSKETGEIFRDTWDAEFECERIRKFLNYKQVYISRMPEETSGAFWDATIYSPRNKKKRTALAVKNGLDTKKYGSFSREQFAYFFIYEYRDKKGKRAYAFSPVPVRVASAVSAREDALEEFARKEAAAAGGKFTRILRSKIYKYQVIEVGADRFYITGKKEVRNARQLAFSVEEAGILNGNITTPDARTLINGIFYGVQARMPLLAPRLNLALGMDEMGVAFSELNDDDAMRILMSIVSIAGAKTNMVDLLAVGGSRYSGCLSLTFSKLLSSKDGITFIDQSVTGMFEKRTTVGGL